MKEDSVLGSVGGKELRPQWPERPGCCSPREAKVRGGLGTGPCQWVCFCCCCRCEREPQRTGRFLGGLRDPLLFPVSLYLLGKCNTFIGNYLYVQRLCLPLSGSSRDFLFAETFVNYLVCLILLFKKKWLFLQKFSSGAVSWGFFLWQPLCPNFPRDIHTDYKGRLRSSLIVRSCVLTWGAGQGLVPDPVEVSGGWFWA